MRGRFLGEHTENTYSRLALGVLLIILCLGLCLRLYRLEEQSIWTDEWPNVAHLHAPDPLTYVRLIELQYPEQAHAPAFYFANYYWSRLVGSEVQRLRLLPILFGLLGIPLIYALAKLIHSPFAGLVAALCLALSPQHIWYSQEIRPYSLLTPIAVLSTYALLRATGDKKLRWWLLNLTLNAIAPWVHLFMVLLPFLQGLWLLVLARRHWRRFICWTILQMLLLLPWAFWMAQLPYNNEHKDHLVSPARIAEDIFADDIVSFHIDMLPSWKTHVYEQLEPWLQRRLTHHAFFDYALLLVFCLGVVRLLYPLLKKSSAVLSSFRRAAPAKDAEPSTRDATHRLNPPSKTADEHSRLSDTLLLLALLCVPGLVLGALSLVLKRPFLSPMYSMYNSAGLYIGLGMALAAIPSKAGKAVALAMVGGLYGYQLAITLPDTTRSDWKGAAAAIAEHGARGDLVLEFEYFWPSECIRYYLDENKFQFRRVPTLQAALDDAATFLDAHPSKHAWVVFESAFISWLFPKYNLQESVQCDSRVRNLIASIMIIKGHRNLAMVRLEPPQEGGVTGIGVPVTPFWPIDFRGILAACGIADPSMQQIERLRKVIVFWPPLNRSFFLTNTFDLIELGDFDLAELFARKLISENPSFGLAHLALGIVLAGQGKHEEAKTAFERAYALHAGLRTITGRFTDALVNTTEEGAAQKSLEVLRSLNCPYVAAFERSLRRPATYDGHARSSAMSHN